MLIYKMHLKKALDAFYITTSTEPF